LHIASIFPAECQANSWSKELNNPYAAPPEQQEAGGKQRLTYDQLPWYRKSGVNTVLILVSLLTCGMIPGTLVVCINALTGEIYFDKIDEKGNLKKWHWTNKVVAVVLLAINIAQLVRVLT